MQFALLYVYTGKVQGKTEQSCPTLKTADRQQCRCSIMNLEDKSEQTFVPGMRLEILLGFTYRAYIH